MKSTDFYFEYVLEERLIYNPIYREIVYDVCLGGKSYNDEYLLYLNGLWE